MFVVIIYCCVVFCLCFSFVLQIVDCSPVCAGVLLMGPWLIYMFLPDIFFVLFYFLIYFLVENGELWMVVILFSQCVSIFYFCSDLIWEGLVCLFHVSFLYIQFVCCFDCLGYDFVHLIWV